MGRKKRELFHQERVGKQGTVLCHVQCDSLGSKRKARSCKKTLAKGGKVQSKCVITALLWATTNHDKQRYRTELKPSFSPRHISRDNSTMGQNPQVSITVWETYSHLRTGVVRRPHDQDIPVTQYDRHVSEGVLSSLIIWKPKMPAVHCYRKSPRDCWEKQTDCHNAPEKPSGQGQLSFPQFQPDSHTKPTNFIF